MGGFQREQEDLRRDAAIDMDFLVAVAIDRDIEHDGLENARYGGGGEENFSEELKALRIAAIGDVADIPDDAALRLEIRCADQQAAALAVLRADFCE